MPITRTSLLVRLRDGVDPTGWHEFVRLYEPMLRTYVRRARVPDQDVSDVVQDILIRLVRTLPRFEYSPARGRFRAWLGTVCRTAILDWRRAQPTHRTVSIADDPAARTADEDWCWDLEHQRHVLQHALSTVRAQVSTSSWNCFERYVLDGQPAGTVAEALHLTPAAVYVITSRIRARLRKKCAQFDEDLT